MVTATRHHVRDAIRAAAFLFGLIVALSAASATDGSEAGAVQPRHSFFRVPADWTATDTRRQAWFTLAAFGDYATTRDLTRRYDEGYYESWGKLFGSHPSTKQVDIFFVLWIPGHYLIARRLDADWRPAWQWGGAITHALATIHNRQLGLKFEF
jgi:hypothetical protein